jgi:F0F1-type ATP synthase epsilon subunit
VPLDWDQSSEFETDLTQLEREPLAGVPFESPATGLQARDLARWGKDLARWLQVHGGITLLQAPRIGLVARAGEAEADFRIRVAQAARESRDTAVERLRARHANRLTALTERVRRAEARVQAQAAQANQKKLETAVSMGVGIFGGFFGRRSLSSRAGTAIRSAGRAFQESKDVDRAKEDVEAARAALAEAEARISEEVRALELGGEEPLVPLPLVPRPSDVSLDLVAVLWVAE